MKPLLGLLILVYLHYSACLSDADNDIIVLRNLVIRSNEDAVKLLKYPNHKNVRLHSVEIPRLTVTMLRNLESVKTLQIVSSILKTIHILPQLKMLHVNVARLSEVIINPADSFDLEILTVVGADLTNIPGNLGSLQKLRHLRLHNCRIEHVNADDFSDLQHLESIDLAGNRLASIGSSAVILPELESLDLSFNRLTEVSFEHWSAPKLRNIFLTYNELTMATSILRSFPTLEILRLAGNPLHCLWRDYIVKESELLNVTMDSPIHCDEASISEMVSSQSKYGNLDGLIADLREELGKALAEIQRLQGLNDDMVEAFYRYTVEKD